MKHFEAKIFTAILFYYHVKYIFIFNVCPYLCFYHVHHLLIASILCLLFKTCVLVFLNNVFDVSACTNPESFVREAPTLTFFFFFFFLVNGMERGSRYQ